MKITNVTTDDGTVSPPEVPDAGIDPNYEVLEPFRVA